MSKLWINPNDMLAHNTMKYTTKKKKKKNIVYRTRDTDEDIQMCLNCTKPECKRGICSAFIKRHEEKD